MQQRRYGLGVLLVIIGGVFLSSNGLMLRYVEQANGWQILFYRGVAFSITLLLILSVTYRRNTLSVFRAIGRRGVWAGLALGFAGSCYVFALLLTTVANAMFILGAAPLTTALGAWLVLNERTSTSAVVAMLFALAGIALLFADGFAAGRWLGNVVALGVVAGFTVYLLIIRGERDVDMLPAAFISGIVMAVSGLLMADNLDVQTNDLVVVLIMGCVQITVGFMCYTIAARYLLAAEVALFALTESVLAPLWVWVGVGETPSALTLAGSAIVLLSVLVYCVIEIGNQRRVLSHVA